MVAGLDNDMVKMILGSTYTDDNKIIGERVKRVLGASQFQKDDQKELCTASKYNGL